MMNCKVRIDDIQGDVIRDNETYVLRDNRTLHDLVLSQTILHRGQETRGHSHAGQEEVYFFVHGQGKIVVATNADHIHPEEIYNVKSGDIVLIPDGKFHRVYNTGDSDLIFNCVFNGKRNH